MNIKRGLQELHRLQQLLLFKSDARSFFPNVLFKGFSIKEAFQFVIQF